MSSASERNDAHNRRTVVQLGAMMHDHFVGCVDEAFRSVDEGSEITGAAGQPVGQYGPGYHPGKVGGYLKASWQKVFVSRDSAIIGTNTDYAESIEDGLSYAHGGTPMTLRSTEGGFHSVKTTVAGMGKIRDVVAERVKREHGEGGAR